MSKMFDNEESYRPKSEEFPLKKQLILFGVGWLGFRIVAAVVEIFILLGFSLANPEYPTDEIFNNIIVKTALNSGIYTVMLVAMILISNVDLKRLKDSFATWKGFLAGLVGFAALYGFSVVYGTFINLLNINISDNVNETNVESVINAFPLISFVIIGIFAPVCEEFTYRVGLFGFLSRKNKIMAYCVAPIVFALIHFTLDFSNIVNELLNIPYYLFAGFTLTYLYDRFGFAGSVTAHILNNSVSEIINLFN